MADVKPKLEKGKDRLGDFMRVKGTKRKAYFNSKEEQPEAETRVTVAKSQEGDLEFEKIDPSRMIMLFDQFDQESSSKIVSQLINMDKTSSDDVTIFINSYGGEVNSLQAILDTMGNMRSKVNTVCLGMAASCGSALFAAGASRYIGARSRVLIHNVTGGAFGTPKQMEDRAKEIQEVENKLFGELANKSGQTVAFIKNIVKNTDVILNSEESIEFGIADAVLLCKDLTKIENKMTAYASASKVDIAEFSRLASMVSTYALDDNKGVERMELQDMLETLKAEHSIDIDALQLFETKYAEVNAQYLESQVKLEATTLQLSETSAKLLESEKLLGDTKLEVLLDKLIDEGKATQQTNELNRIAFNTIGYIKALEMAKVMPVLVKLQPEAMHSSNNSEQEEMTRYKKVKAYMVANGMEDTPENYLLADAKA